METFVAASRGPDGRFSVAGLTVVMVLIACSPLLYGDSPSGALRTYIPFDGNLDAIRAPGNPHATYGHRPDREGRGDSDRARFVEGLRGQAFRTGVSGQNAYYRAGKNVPDEQWTITFWVKGLPETDFMSYDRDHQQFFELLGDRWLRFYKYNRADQPWVLVHKGGGGSDVASIIKVRQQFDVHEWHFFAVTYRSEQRRLRVYLDGSLAAQGHGVPPVTNTRWLRVGQTFGGDDKPNRLLDEFKIYDRVLTPAEIARQRFREGPFRTEPRVTVPKTSDEIKMDGKLDEPAWRDAAGVAGFVSGRTVDASQSETNVLTTYNDTHLYVAMRSSTPKSDRNDPERNRPNGPIRSSVTHHDTDLGQDDYFGIMVQPDPNENTFYRLLTNGIETTHESVFRVGDGTNLDWNPSWEVRSNVTPEQWTVESRIPLDAFGPDGVDPGDRWRVQFVRNWRLLKEDRTGWAYDARSQGAKNGVAGVLHFKGDRVSARLTALEQRPHGRVVARGRLRNHSSDGQNLTLTLKAGEKTVVRRTLDVAAGRRVPFELPADLRRTDGRVLTIEIKDRDGNVLYYQRVPYIPPENLTLWLTKYPSKQLLSPQWNLHRRRPNGSKTLSAQITVSKKSEPEPVVSKQIDPLPGTDGRTTVDTGELDPGTYTVRMVIRNSGNRIASRSVRYRKEKRPEWLGNDIGLTEHVPEPWIPINVDGDAISTWGRTYHFDRSLLPEQITNQNRNMLAGPVKLRYASATEGASNPVSTRSGAKVNWHRKQPGRVKFERTRRIDQLEVTNESYVEFDGMVWTKLRVEPREETASVRRLTVEVPMKRTYAHLINTYDYHLQNTGSIPEDGYRSDMGARWIGHEEGGIQFFAEHAHNWKPGDRSEFAVLPRKDRTLVQLRLIGEPTQVSEPMTFAFGFIVTPVRPTPEDHREWRVMSGRTRAMLNGKSKKGSYLKRASKVHPGLKVYHPWTLGWWKNAGMYEGNPDDTGFYPIPREGLAADWGSRTSQYGVPVHHAPYGRLRATWAASPEYEQFGGEWNSSMNEPFLPDEDVDPALRQAKVCQNARSFRDFTLFGYKQLLENTSARALYFDVSKPHRCNNLLHGCGFSVDDGIPKATTNYLGTRKLLKRIYVLMRKKRDRGRIFVHMSGQVNMAIYAFADALVDGENYHSLLDRNRNRGYENVLELDQFAAEYAAQNNFGPVSVMLPQFHRSGAINPDEWRKTGYQPAEYLLGLLFLHDSQLWWAYLPHQPTSASFFSFDEHGLTSDYHFIGYWEQDVLDLPENVRASFYESPDRDRTFMVLMNFSDREQTVDARAVLSAHGSGRRRKVTRVYPSGDENLSEDRLSSIDLPGNNFGVFLITNTD